MPLAIDPAWEYWEPDPEIMEVAFSQRLEGFDQIDDFRLAKQHTLGFRFGSGNPNRFYGKLARPKPERREVNQPLVSCPVCGTAFVTRRRRCCSKSCARRWYWRLRRKRPEQLTCAWCGRVFRPVGVEQVLCGRKCASAKGVHSQRVTAAFISGDVTSRADLGMLQRLYEAGEPMKQIASQLGISLPQCNRLRTKLGLQVRRPNANKPKGGLAYAT